MYITTFYSFKGGVGRTMALVNAAVELASTGRRVLVVDFDLEAPGLDTFDLLRSETQVAGIIDLVGEYLTLDQAPDVSRFISQAPGIGDEGGGLWFMPSGTQDEAYAANFSQIDWNVLYEKHDGYLLFEDLKEQWKQVVKPDYVLVDSRTGHTDIGGICTRQLPDAVVTLFFPNDQNLRGLTKVVQDIRAEASGPREKEIELHFVMSNVPDLDDENRILESKIDAFQDRLGFTREPRVVHRYDSMSLLNQVVFTKDRPHSRLAKEYRAIVQELIRSNPSDREGSLEYVRRAIWRWRRQEVNDEPSQRVDRRLRQIEEKHSSDGEVLFNIGVLQDERQSEKAASLFDRAIETGYDEPEIYLRRARLRADNGDIEGASADALKVLQFSSVPQPLVRQAIRLATNSNSGEIGASRAVISLDPDERISLAESLSSLTGETEIAVSILHPLVGDNFLSDEKRRSAVSALALAYIGIREFTKAIDILSHGGRHVDEMEIRDTFNYGMAIWGSTGNIVPDPFYRVVTLHVSDQGSSNSGPNYLQCMAVAYWASGNQPKAIEFVQQAREVMGRRRGLEFSCWRYRRVAANTFIEDLNEIHALINGDTSKMPRFMAPTKLKKTLPGESSQG